MFSSWDHKMYLLQFFRKLKNIFWSSFFMLLYNFFNVYCSKFIVYSSENVIFIIGVFFIF